MCRLSCDKESKNFASELREAQNRHEAVLREVTELNVQLKIIEESRDGLRQSLSTANQQLHEGLKALSLL